MIDPWQLGGDGSEDIIVSTPNAIRWSVNADGPFAIYLPHSCDEWVIADSKDADGAIAQLDRFIAALGDARERLQRAVAGARDA